MDENKETPLTLAESIRKKIEAAKASQEDSADAADEAPSSSGGSRVLKCPACRATYTGLVICPIDRTMLLAIKSGKPNWFDDCELFECKFCPKCKRVYERAFLDACIYDGFQLEGYDIKWRPGPTLEDRFQLLSYIGENRIFKLYSASDQQRNEKVLVKILRREHRGDQKTVSHFLKSVRPSGDLQHPKIVPVRSVNVMTMPSVSGHDSFAPYLVTDYLVSNTLEEELKRQLFIDVQTSLKIFLDVLEALSYSHSNGVIHGAISVSHIYLSSAEDGGFFARLGDFGVTERLLRDLEWDGPSTATSTANVYGDFRIISPEYCHGKRATEQTDVYLLACALYEALSGKPPFVRPGITQMLFAHFKDEPDDINAKGLIEVPAELARVVYKCLSKEPSDRYTVQALKDELIGLYETGCGKSIVLKA